MPKVTMIIFNPFNDIYLLIISVRHVVMSKGKLSELSHKDPSHHTHIPIAAVRKQSLVCSGGVWERVGVCVCTCRSVRAVTACARMRA